MTLPNDPVEALKWAFNHSGDVWWLIGAIVAGIAWTSKRMSAWNRRNALTVRALAARPAAPAQPSAAPAPAPAATRAASAPYAAAPSYQASGYAAQPAYAAPVAAAAAAPTARRLQRDAAPAQRVTSPVARSVDAPASSGAWTLTGVFGDPAHARTAIVVAEVLGPPLGLR